MNLVLPIMLIVRWTALGFSTIYGPMSVLFKRLKKRFIFIIIKKSQFWFDWRPNFFWNDCHINAKFKNNFLQMINLSIKSIFFWDQNVYFSWWMFTWKPINMSARGRVDDVWLKLWWIWCINVHELNLIALTLSLPIGMNAPFSDWSLPLWSTVLINRYIVSVADLL